MKNRIKYILQLLLGYPNYLYYFSIYKIKTLRSDKKENDFFQFLKLIPENSLVIDIGANLGIMTYYLSHLKNSEVAAIEPMPDNISTFKKIVSHFDLNNVKLFECALGETEGEIEMVLPVEGKAKQQGLAHVVHNSINDFNEGIKFKVPLKNLDKLIADNYTAKVAAFKIDVENFEYFVLKGATNILTDHKPVIYIELWDNENRANCFNLIKSFDYKIMIVENEILTAFDETKHHTQNFIFLP